MATLEKQAPGRPRSGDEKLEHAARVNLGDSLMKWVRDHGGSAYVRELIVLDKAKHEGAIPR